MQLLNKIKDAIGNSELEQGMSSTVPEIIDDKPVFKKCLITVLSNKYDLKHCEKETNIKAPILYLIDKIFDNMRFATEAQQFALDVFQYEEKLQLLTDQNIRDMMQSLINLKRRDIINYFNESGNELLNEINLLQLSSLKKECFDLYNLFLEEKVQRQLALTQMEKIYLFLVNQNKDQLELRGLGWLAYALAINLKVCTWNEIKDWLLSELAK